MLQQVSRADSILEAAIAALRTGDNDLLASLDELPAPIYVTDPDGFVTHFNRSCVGFAGRMPAAGRDRWCVTWKLYTDAGEVMRHDQCPMADAIKGRRAIRGLTALAERPDGTRVHFMPFPTPIFSADGEFLGAVNMLIDITEKEQAGELRLQAARCRRLARGTDQQTSRNLGRLAMEYEARADAMDLLARSRN